MINMWSRKHEMCLECNTTERPHRALGLCVLCYTRQYREKNRQKIREYECIRRRRPEVRAKRLLFNKTPERREYDRKRQAVWRKENPEKNKAIIARWRSENQDKMVEYRNRPEVKERTRRNYLRRKYGDNAFMVLERDNYTCIKCGSKKRISIHHIDWNENNNTLDNLVLLCSSCHGKLHSFIPQRLRKQIFEEWITCS